MVYTADEKAAKAAAVAAGRSPDRYVCEDCGATYPEQPHYCPNCVGMVLIDTEPEMP